MSSPSTSHHCFKVLAIITTICGSVYTIGCEIFRGGMTRCYSLYSFVLHVALNIVVAQLIFVQLNWILFQHDPGLQVAFIPLSP